MDHRDHNPSRVQSPVTRNPWRAFVPTSARDVYRDPPTDEATLQSALSAWQETFGGRQVTLGIKDTVRFEQGTVLGSGGLGAVYETTLGGVAVAWKRVYTRRLTDWHLNEIKILGQIAEDRHKHIITFIGSYVQRQRNSTYEVAIFTWPVAKCDLAVLLHQVDLIYEWKKRDKAWDEHDSSDSPTEEEKAAYDNLLELVQLDHERYRTFTWTLREKLLKAISQRLQRSVGCIAEAVKYLHSHNIRHKDIKPSQILLSTRSLWLTDFGWSKDISQLTNSQTSGGDRITIRYHAPERAQLGKCGRPEDIFALGCTFLEMSYPIYGIRAADYINPAGALMWSFQLNLRHIHSWLAPLIVRDSRTDWPLLFQNLIREMMREDPSDRPVIEDILLELQVKNRSAALFGDCCQPPITLRSAETNSEEYNENLNHCEIDEDNEGGSSLSGIDEDLVYPLQDDRQMLVRGDMGPKEDFDRSDGEEESSDMQTDIVNPAAYMTVRS